MEEHDFEKIKEEIKKQLDSSRQNWLFGAGISQKSLFFILEIIIGMETYIYSDNGNLEFFNYFFTLIHSI